VVCQLPAPGVELLVLDVGLYLGQQLGRWLKAVLFGMLSGLPQDLLFIGTTHDVAAVAGRVDLVAVDDLAHVLTSFSDYQWHCTAGRWGGQTAGGLSANQTEVLQCGDQMSLLVQRTGDPA
jgi:hypothetical protein